MAAACLCSENVRFFGNHAILETSAEKIYFVVNWPKTIPDIMESGLTQAAGGTPLAPDPPDTSKLEVKMEMIQYEG